MKELSAFLHQIKSEASWKTLLSATYNFDAVNTYFDIPYGLGALIIFFP